MRIKFWGTRGSIAKPGAATARYGGNTSCVEIRSASGVLIVIDCGTGGHDLGQALIKEKRPVGKNHLLISHTHWDHIQGIPFFAPFFMPGSDWDIYGPKGLSRNLQSILASQMEHTYFPITLNQFAATTRYHDLVEGTFTVDDVTISTRYLNHPALTLAYRIEADGGSVVYCCDHEPYERKLASGELAITGADGQHVEFLAGADAVLHDAQYTASEYPSKVGWGHSTVEYAVRVSREALVKTLFLTHHDPLRDDDAIDRIIEETKTRLRAEGSALEVRAAAEGLSVTVEGDPARPSGTKARFGAKTAVEVPSTTRPVLLYVKSPSLNALLCEAITLEGIPRRVVSDDEELREAVVADQPSLILAEHNLPHVDGNATVHLVRESQGAEATQVPIVLVTNGTPGERDRATDWLTAPFSLSYARTKIRAWVLRSACRWVRAQLPPDETQRLKVLHALSILDTPAEERFDRVTRLAAAALRVPVALVSLVDEDRQWFKSCFGMDVREIGRDQAFCAHVVHQKTELVVPDTLLDDRFADNPLVQGEPRIRFYAGAPLIMDDGTCLGTLCVVDTRPRQLDPAELASLRDLRDLALEQIRSREA